MRILLRQNATGLYLQPSGQWTENRETARDFQSAVGACYWALAQRLEGIHVLYAFANPALDVAAMAVPNTGSPPAKRPVQ